MIVQIDGVATPLRVNSLSIDNAVGQRSTCSLTLVDDTGANHYSEGQRVDVLDDANGNALIYSGVLDADDESMPDSAVATGLLYHKVTCKDWHYLADKRLVATSYASGQTCGAVIADVVTNWLAEEGVYSVLNLLSANQSNVEANTTGFGVSGGTTISRDTTQFWQGAASLKVVNDGTIAFQGANIVLSSTGLVAGGVYTWSAYVYGAAGQSLIIKVQNSASPFTSYGVTNFTGANSWQRVSVTATLPSALPANIQLLVFNSGTFASTFYLDGMQFEMRPSVSTWEVGGTNTVVSGVTLPDVVFNYCTAAAAFDALAQKAGAYWWQIDAQKRLWFQPYTALTAPWALTSSGGVVTDARYGTVRVKRAKPLYRNTQYIRGATGTTSTQTETRKGDGSTKAFTMGYPFAKVPTVTVNSVSKTVGIKGLDTGKDWYWNAGDATLTQDSAGTTLISTDTLQVVYVGTYPLIIISADDAQVSAQQTLEGGGTSGKVEDITEDAALTTTDAAFTEAAALLAKYGQNATTLQFQTQRTGLAPGQLLSVTIPEHGFSSASFLIESIHITDEDGQVIWYDVTAIQGPVNTTWVQFFGQLVTNASTSSNTLNVGSSTALVIAAPFSASYTPSATFTPTVYACPLFPATFPLTLC